MLELDIEAIGAAGDGVATLGGDRYFVPYTAPGDRVRARVTGRRGGALAAEVVERFADGPCRAEPPCPHFGAFGGCALQHLDDRLYADWTRERVATALARRGLGGVVVEAAARTPAGARRRAAFHAVRRTDGVRMGFRARSSHRVVALRECPVLDPSLVALLGPLRELFTGLLTPGQRAEALVARIETGIDLVIAAPNAPDLAGRERVAELADACDVVRVSWRGPGDASPEIVVQRLPARAVFAGVAVDLPPGAFLQPSAAGEAALVAFAAAATADAARVADLYAGCGAFTFALEHIRFRRNILH